MYYTFSNPSKQKHPRHLKTFKVRDSKRDTDIQNSLLDSVGEGEGRMIWENGIETCIIPYMK